MQTVAVPACLSRMSYSVIDLCHARLLQARNEFIHLSERSSGGVLSSIGATYFGNGQILDQYRDSTQRKSSFNGKGRRKSVHHGYCEWSDQLAKEVYPSHLKI